MCKRLLVFFGLAIFIFTAFSSCKKYYPSESSEDEYDGTVGYEEASDYVWNSSDITDIALSGSSITINGNGVTADGSILTIISPGTYRVTGSLTDGQVIVKTGDAGIVRIILNGADIKCSESAPIYVKSAEKVLLVLADGTENSVTDGASYSLNDDGEPDAAIFSKSYLSFYGNGSLAVKANYSDGIAGKDGLVIKNGTIDVTSADDGIRGRDYIIIRNGKISVESKGDGMKSTNDEDSSLGYITVDSAELNINAAGGDGINAQTDVTINDGLFTITTGGGAGSSATSSVAGGGFSGPQGGSGSSSGYSGTVSEKAIRAQETLTIQKGTFNINSADDAIHSNNAVIINGGTFEAATGDDAIHAETSVTINGGAINFSKCYEGIESALITVNSGDISIVSSDDGFNATKGTATEQNDGSFLYIYGGDIYVNASVGDGLDSNGSIEMTAGTVVINGPQSSPEVAYDYNGTFNISGGIFAASGPNSGNMIQNPGSSSSQYIVKATTQSGLSASTLFHIEDAGGKDLLTFKSVRNLYYVVFSSADLANGSTYSVFTGGTSTGTYTNGLYKGGTYSGGTLKKSFTISGKISTISY